MARAVASYLGWIIVGAAGVICLGSLQGFASGLDHLTRELDLNGAAEASLVYDRNNHLIFSFATEDRTNVPLARVSSSMVSAVLAAEDRDFNDAWFVGYTPTLVAGAWFGHDEKKTIMNRGFAGTVAVPAWTYFMKRVTDSKSTAWFDMPSDIERIKVCRKSGLKAAAACRISYTEDGRPNTYDDVFLNGTGPYEICGGDHADRPPLEPAPFYDGSFCRVLTIAPITPRPTPAIATIAIQVVLRPRRLAP